MATANLLQTSVSGGTQNALSLQGDGVFFPKASTTSRLALTLTTTDKGFIVYDTTDNNIYFWNGAAWESVPSSGDAGANGSVQYNDNGIVSGATNFTYDKATSAVSIAGALTLTGGTANGVPYLNASKVVTTGSNLSFANTPGFFDTTLNINSLLGSALYRGGITVAEDNVGFTLFGGSGYKLIQTSGFSTPNELIFYVSNAEAARFKSSGNLAFPNAKGIDFSATPGTGTSELLNDYEEGTFTPTVGGTATYTAQSGRYTKIGNRVYVNMRLTILLLGTGSNFQISGLPFAVGGSAPLGSVSVGYFANLAISVYYISGYAATGSPNIVLTASGSITTTITNGFAAIGDGTDLALSFFYEV